MYPVNLHVQSNYDKMRIRKTSKTKFFRNEKYWIEAAEYRNSRPEVFCKKGVLRNFTKFTGNHLCQSLFFNKVAGPGLWHKCFPVNFVKFLRTSLFIEHLWWLLLRIPGNIGDIGVIWNNALSWVNLL